MSSEDANDRQVDELVNPPKLFISYNWTDSAHETWVVQLATDLKSNGVDVVLDRWSLKEGQDAHVFMEQMVRSKEIEKIVLVCDRKYVQRANKREGGVGVESQVITSELYKDVNQTKIVGVITESDTDGKPALPTFLQNRVFIDFRDRTTYSERLQQLLRWVFDKPLYREPEVGPRPAFLDDQVNYEPIRLSQSAGLGHNSQKQAQLALLIEELRQKRSDFTVQMDDEEPNDETVYRAIKSLPAVLGQAIENFTEKLATSELSESEVDATIQYVEALYSNYEEGSTAWSGDATKFFAQFFVTGLIARCIKFRRFASAQRIMKSKLLKHRHDELTADAHPMHQINCFLRSLEARNKRLKLRRLSLHSDLIKETCDLLRFDLSEYIQADLILFLNVSDWNRRRYWWPDSAMFVTNAYGKLPWFIRAEEREYRDMLLPLIGVHGANELDALLSKLRTGEIPEIKWPGGFDQVEIPMLLNFEAIRATYD